VYTLYRVCISFCTPKIVSAAPLISCSVPDVGWVRVGGTLAYLFGFYYFGAALDDVEGRFPYRFYQSTVIGRLFLAVVFLVLVLTEQSHRSLLILVAANIVSALAMNKQIGRAVASGRNVRPPM
jgi:hypothetical protein